MKNKIVLTALTICMTASLSTAYASNIKTFVGDGKITYTGSVGKENIGKDIFFEVLKKGFELNEESWNTEDASNIIFADAVKSDADGGFSLAFDLADSGLYPVVKNYGTDDGEDIEYIGFTKDSDFTAAIAELSQKQENEIADYIDANRDKLAMYDDIFNIPAADVVKLVKNSITATSTYSDLLMVYAAKSYELGKDVNLNQIFSDMVDKDDKLAKYFKAYNESLYEEGLKNGYEKTSQFYDKLKESIILSNIYKNDGVSEVTAMLNDYAAELGIKTTLTDGKADALVGKRWTMPQLVDYINKIPQSSKGDGAGGNGTRVPSGSTGGSIAGNTVSVGSVQKNTKPSQTEVFKDIDSVPWAKDAINALFNRGVVSGSAEGVFSPQSNVKREELITMIVRQLKLNITGDTPQFKDVDKNAWYFDTVKTAFNCGITKGYSEDRFGIGDDITRQDMATMIYNAITTCGVEVPEKTGNAANFADKNSIAPYAADAINYLYSRGVIGGYEDNTFGPTKNATRAEVAVMLNRISPYIK